ncbi:type II secretion system protein M [Aliiglaciecola sp. 3_MG-2023]|uniref:type II secretion system protein M n=1 Tax=Aliiglaciecola sp. 3_MG-2023 TaxID=3062644 RepID=UPI0026E4401A|nr:type II secretion system protein M [Aliiglaciecola sp. 3_MG-2023]MDO6694386.1 type II secretion system protein M [Aliiglaciecola sp. 3_MG-2023]
MQDLLDKFNQLSERERILVAVSGVLLIIFLFYYIVWAPIDKSLETQSKLVATKQSDLLWFKQNANRAIQMRSGNGAATVFTGSLPQAVNKSAGRVNIAISRMQPQGDELKVWVDQAPFNDVLSWLQSLENLGIRIINVDLAEANVSGMVKVRSLQLGKS